MAVNNPRKDPIAAPTEAPTEALSGKVRVRRTTTETDVRVEACLAGPVSADTGIDFLDHMLAVFGRYSGLGLTVSGQGDLEHHLSEDVALAVGAAVARLVPDTAARYGERTVPMDDALVQAVVDVGGRFYYEGALPDDRYTHWLRSFAEQARATVHVRVIRGTDRHHVVEAAFKAVGLAVREALVDTGMVFSTKGSVVWEVVEC